jgi:hypothetical protein
MAKDFAKLAEKIAEAARQGVQVERRLWQQKLEEEQKRKQIAKAS